MSRELPDQFYPVRRPAADWYDPEPGLGAVSSLLMIDTAGALRGAETAGIAGARVDHVGIAVRSLAAARRLYESLGLVVGPGQAVPQEQVTVAMVALGETRVELLEAHGADVNSPVGRFIARRGEGIHHLALWVADVDAAYARMSADGVATIDGGVRSGAGGHRYFFVHPSSAGGVLLEIVGDASAEVDRT